MNKTYWLAGLLVAIALTGCHRDHEHPHPKAGPDAAHEHGGAIAITHYADATELFVEFPLLVRGEEASFAAHLTRMSDFKAVEEGLLVVTLTGGGQPAESGEAPVSNVPGIFRPVLKPQHAGKRRLIFELAGGATGSRHDVGEVVVHSDKAAAKAAAPAEAEQGIKFTKEQQWKMDFGSAPAAEREIRESVAVTATLRPRASGEAHLAAPGAGLLRAGPGGFPQVGMKVAAGQVLAYLVPRLGGETDSASLTLAVQRARIEAEQARQERGRLEGLLAVEAIAAKRVVDARNRERLAEAELKTAEQRTAVYQGGSGGIALRSPIAGAVVAVSGSPGAAVTEGQTVVHVAALDKLWIEARVPETELGRITSPSGVFFQLDGAAGTTVLEVGRNARLIAFGGLVDKDTRTVPAIFEFDNQGGTFRAGMNLQVRLFTGRSLKGVAIPVSALVDDAGQLVAYVQKEGESFQRRIVETGPRDGEWVAIRSGIASGERVVHRGAYQVRLAAAQPATAGHGHAH